MTRDQYPLLVIVPGGKQAIVLNSPEEVVENTVYTVIDTNYGQQTKQVGHVQAAA